MKLALPSKTICNRHVPAPDFYCSWSTSAKCDRGVKSLPAHYAISLIFRKKSSNFIYRLQNVSVFVFALHKTGQTRRQPQLKCSMTSVSFLSSKIQIRSSRPGARPGPLVTTRDSKGGFGMMPCARRGSIKERTKGQDRTGDLSLE